MRVGTYALYVSSTREMSCSQSFETNSESTKYELTIAADGTATLAVSVRASSLFGPSSGKFTGGGSKQERAANYRYVGRATAEASATKVEATDSKTSYKAFLTCKPSSTELTTSSTADAGRERVDSISCTGLPMLGDEAAAYFKGPAPLAEGTGLFFATHDFGHGTSMETLRRGF